MTTIYKPNDEMRCAALDADASARARRMAVRLRASGRSHLARATIDPADTKVRSALLRKGDPRDTHQNLDADSLSALLLEHARQQNASPLDLYSRHGRFCATRQFRLHV
jgi:hypothetical protein